MFDSNAIINAILGGLLIGAAAGVLVYALGRVMGVSGVLVQAFSSLNVSENAWRWIFLIGMLLGVFIIHQVFNVAVPTTPGAGPAKAIIAGLIVGIGVNLGSGCTSGHGICGLSRFSTRSLVATLTFMFVAVITVYVDKLV